LRNRLLYAISQPSLYIVIVLVFALVSCKKDKPAPVVPVAPPPTPVSYKLVWSDEFDGDTINANNWNIETGNPGVDNEREYNQKANTAISEGNLVITVKKEDAGGFHYTSGRINSMGKITGTYGRVEARIKMPMSVGLAPAFWCMGADIQLVPWPACGEIDIVQHANDENLVYGTMRWDNTGLTSVGYSLTTTPGDYHIYAIDWDVNSIKWYVDDKLYLTSSIRSGAYNTGAFQRPFFIILSMAAGNNFTGPSVDETKLPANMYIDYVRVYIAR
jgi:beta-glucanase (GH16 family)